MGTGEPNVEAHPVMDWNPYTGGEGDTPSGFMLLKPAISISLICHLARMHAFLCTF